MTKGAAAGRLGTGARAEGMAGATRTVGLALVAGAAFAFALVGGPVPAQGDQGLYDRYCLACHGERGDGDGPAAPWLWPKPRDFTRGRYKWRSTPSGRPPTDEDLARAIRKGAPGTSMPGFEGILDERQIASLVQTVKAFAPERFRGPATPLVAPDPPPDAVLASLAARGRALFNTAGCTGCHGEGGKGGGPRAASLRDDQGRLAPPFDLTTRPLRRPGASGIVDIYVTLVTGLDGTAMPSFAGALAEADLWALAAYVEEIRWKGGVRAWDPTAVDPVLRDTVPAGFRIAPQGTPPPSLPPAAASLSSAQCGRCHAKQLREWRESLHAGAASPGLIGQLVHATEEQTRSCQKCHAPLAEQRPGQPGYRATLRHEGVTCAVCHVRGWTRHGPPRRADSGLLALPSYPLVEERRFERSDFCLPCHQLPPSEAVAGRPLLNTYREWLEGPYMRRGVQCQHCHMPDREHRFKGVHDPETVRQGLDLAARARRERGALVVEAVLTNVGAGHHLPTTPTPAAWVTVELHDGPRILATARKRIGRHVRHEGGVWKEIEDTRIPPGESLVFAPRFTGEAAARARSARVTVEMHPDDFYEGFYRRLLARRLPATARAMIETALRRAEQSKYIIWKRELTGVGVK